MVSMEALSATLWCAENAMGLATNDINREYWSAKIRMINAEIEEKREEKTEVERKSETIRRKIDMLQKAYAVASTNECRMYLSDQIGLLEEDLKAVEHEEDAEFESMLCGMVKGVDDEV